MLFDVMLPTTLFFITLATLFTFRKYEDKFRSLLEEKTLKVTDVIVLVAAMGVAVTVMVFVPEIALLTLFLFVYSLLMFVFTYAVVSKWYVAVIPPAVFVALYAALSGVFGYGAPDVWELGLMNLYAVIFAVMITTYLGSMFTWKTTLAFAVLLTVVDIIQVLYTRHMVAAAEHIQSLKFPMLITVPTIPPLCDSQGNHVFIKLGVGDLFFAGLLATQTLRRFSWKHALTAAAGMAVSFFIFETLMFNYALTAFPGTLMIIVGWAAVTLFFELQKLRRAQG